MDEGLVAVEDAVAAREQVALEPALAEVLGQDLHAPVRRARAASSVGRISASHALVRHREDVRQAGWTRSRPARKCGSCRDSRRDDVAQEAAEHARRLARRRARQTERRRRSRGSRAASDRVAARRRSRAVFAASAPLRHTAPTGPAPDISPSVVVEELLAAIAPASMPLGSRLGQEFLLLVDVPATVPSFDRSVPSTGRAFRRPSSDQSSPSASAGTDIAPKPSIGGARFLLHRPCARELLEVENDLRSQQTSTKDVFHKLAGPRAGSFLLDLRRSEKSRDRRRMRRLLHVFVARDRESTVGAAILSPLK